MTEVKAINYPTRVRALLQISLRQHQVQKAGYGLHHR